MVWKVDISGLLRLWREIFHIFYYTEQRPCLVNKLLCMQYLLYGDGFTTFFFMNVYFDFLQKQNPNFFEGPDEELDDEIDKVKKE